jgi:hypothetical protein
VTHTASDFAALTQVILPFAKQAIIDDGGLHPIAAIITSDGHPSKLAPFGEPGEATTEEILAGLLRALGNLVREGRARAAGWCVDMRVLLPNTGEKSDAVVLFREDASQATALVVPYRRNWLRQIKFAPAFEQANPAQLFIGQR